MRLGRKGEEGDGDFGTLNMIIPSIALFTRAVLRHVVLCYPERRLRGLAWLLSFALVLSISQLCKGGLQFTQG